MRSTLLVTREQQGDNLIPDGYVLRLFETKSASAVADPTKLEQKAIGVPFEVKADSIDDETRTFSGLASTWDLDLGGDVIRKGAFKKTLNDWRRSKSIMPLLDSHSAYGTVRAVIGKMEKAEETDAGLEATFSVIDGPDGDEIWRRIKGGYVSGLSIGYRPVKIEMPTEEEEREGVWRYLKEVALREVSVVVWPMNPGAQIDQGSMKAALAALKKTASERELTAEEKAELKALIESGAEPPPPTPEPEPGDKGELTPDDPTRLESDRKLADARLRMHGTRVRDRLRS